MNNSICRFIPTKNEDASIKTVRFVYETECAKLSQPFVNPIYAINIVTRGSAVLRIGESSFELKRGDIFFSFPAYSYYIDCREDFEYIYITFMGTGAAAFLLRCKITPSAPYYPEYHDLCTMFESAIRRITPQNSNMLTEGVLFYTLSFFDNADTPEYRKNPGNLFEAIVDYVEHHYRESDMSLGRLADCFSYTKKYISSLFKKNMKIGFNNYLNNLRVEYANELIEKKAGSIAEISIACGYKEYSYFSKVFKKRTGKTPSEIMKTIENDQKRTDVKGENAD